MKNYFYVCQQCGITAIADSDKVEASCNGQPLTLLNANTVDAAVEKHVPIVTRKDGILTVNVGSVSHPMSAEHHIAWVTVETDQGLYKKSLQTDGAPVVEFALLEGEEVLNVKAYCNLHGLWQSV